MTIGLVLLSADGFYLSEFGTLPRRPLWDKEFITKVIKGKRVLCSYTTLATLPKSMLSIAQFTTDTKAEYDVNFGIDTFKVKPDLLIVSRSIKNLHRGKRFDLSEFDQVVQTEGLEMYTHE